VIIGEYPGDVTDEMGDFGSGTYVEEFVLGGAKITAFSNFPPQIGRRTSNCNGKGRALNYETSKVVKFTTLNSMSLEDNTPLQVYNPEYTMSKHGGVVVSEHKTKEYKVAIEKCRLMKTFDSIPYGLVILNWTAEI
jgi:hypothetical protein